MAEYEGLSEENNRSGRQGSAQRLSCLLCSDPSADTTTPGCCDPTQINYDPAATCDDGSCQPFTYGCTDPTATNYNATNTVADGSCIWLGCLNPTSSNYMGNTIPYGGILPGPYYGGTEWGFAVDDGSCVDGGDWHSGCTDPTALNYDASCAADPLCYSCFLNNCCTYPDPDVLGCTAPTADNYNSLANVDDGSCFIYLCTTPTATNWSGYNTNDPYIFPTSGGNVTGIVISDNTLCDFTTDPTNIDCTLQGAQIVAENIIWDTGRWLNGTLSSLQTWVENHWYYQPTGNIPTNSTPHPCKWFEKMVDKFTNQISDHFAGIPPHASWGPNLLAKKQAILEYFIEMQKVCDCVEDEPTIETECKTIIVDQNRYYRYEHDTDTTTPLIGVGAGSAPIHTIDQPYDVAMWSSKFYAVVEQLDGNGVMMWTIKEYLVNWNNNEYSFVRDIVVNNAIDSIPLAYTMKDANTMLVMTQISAFYPTQAIIAIDITTNIAPTADVVVPWINFPNTFPNEGGDITCYADDTMLVSFSNSDSIRHYYMDTAGGYVGAGPISNATVPSIYGTVGHYTFDNDTYIITMNNSSVNEVRQVTVPSFTTSGPMVISPVLPNVIPSTQFIRGADTSCMDPDEGGDGLYNYRDCYNFTNTNKMFTAVTTPGSAGSGGAPHDVHRYTWREDVIGFDDFCISIANQDVLGNTYSPSDFDISNNPNGYTITIYDNMKNFLGKWHYSGYGPAHYNSPYTSAFYRANQENILTRNSAARVEYNPATGVDDIVGVSFPEGEPGLPKKIILKLKGVTHLAGPNPLVCYGSNSDNYLTQLNNNGVQINNYEIDYELNTRGGFTSSYCFIKLECEATASSPFENIFTGPNTATNNTAAICTGRWWNFEPSPATGIGEVGGTPPNSVNLSFITVPSPALWYANPNWTIEPGYPRLRPSPVSRYGGKLGVYLTGTYHNNISPENAYHPTLGHTNAYGLTNGWGWEGFGTNPVTIQDIRENWPYHYIHPWFASFQPSATLTNNGITWFPNVQTAISATAPGLDQPCVTGTNAAGVSS